MRGTGFEPARPPGVSPIGRVVWQTPAYTSSAILAIKQRYAVPRLAARGGLSLGTRDSPVKPSLPHRDGLSF